MPKKTGAKSARKKSSKPKKIGRPTKYTKKVLEIIASKIRLGLTVEYACACAGIAKATYAIWLEKPDFLDLIDKAKAEGQAARLERITAAAEAGDIEADKWHLTHVHAEQFATTRVKQRLEHSGRVEGGEPSMADLEALAASWDNLRLRQSQAPSDKPKGGTHG